MSTAAAKATPSTVGNTARALPLRSPDAGRRVRTPLSVVRGTPGKRRVPFFVFCFGVLAAALLTVLVLNISVSTAQYDLVQLKAQAATLTKQNQELTQQRQAFEAPQNLAAKAAQLGMVASTAKGQINLETLAITGTATPAPKGAGLGAVIAAPAITGQLDVVPPASTKDPLESHAPSTDADAKADAKDAKAAGKDDAKAKPAEKKDEPKAPAVNLNGGSVPAPQQKAPGQ
ncbi:hypothetical protein [Arthrobacter cupressi]|uniref:Cell division protein FtsL n=1 Tax=Arthrobacter cupressi TaxID=1045773 RepID=A0A1G8VLM1_9MICC|nr:hypothetical protein [Arthrobacter cupressi]NYD79497.1 outer membrane murein-binding lipoprotein Lpp [Arthrobacter cupressi]SDJ66854.1 hypothetical protein SAMN05216555_11472 [Arthrobacter cupressi]